MRRVDIASAIANCSLLIYRRAQGRSSRFISLLCISVSAAADHLASLYSASSVNARTSTCPSSPLPPSPPLPSPWLPMLKRTPLSVLSRTAISSWTAFSVGALALLLAPNRSLIGSPSSGFSYKPPPRAPFTAVLKAFQTTVKPIVSVDIPSGWDVEEGKLNEEDFTPGELYHNFTNRLPYTSG